MSIAQKARPLLLSEEAQLISTDEYISMIQANDIKSATSRIIHRRVGEAINIFIEQKKMFGLDDLFLLIDDYYQRKLMNLCASNNKYTSVMEEISDLLNGYLATQCFLSLKKPCVFFPNGGLYRHWVSGGEKGLIDYMSSDKTLSVIYKKATETGKIDVKDFFYHAKPLWDKIVVQGSFPARKTLGLFHDFALLRTVLTVDSVDTTIISSAYIPRDDLLMITKGLKENKLENLRLLDKHLPTFSETFSDLTRIAPRTASLDVALILSLGYLTKNLTYDFNEINLRKYLLLLREAFLLRLVYLTFLSGMDKSIVMNLITRRLT
jgi:Leucine-rich repeat (LRR) protein